MKQSGAVKKQTNAEEIAICKYLNCFDEIKVAAQYCMLAQCANSFLKSNHTNQSAPPPLVSKTMVTTIFKMTFSCEDLMPKGLETLSQPSDQLYRGKQAQ